MKYESAFTMDTSSIKYGPGVTQEVGYDMKNLGATRVLVVTDPETLLFTMEGSPLPRIETDSLLVHLEALGIAHTGRQGNFFVGKALMDPVGNRASRKAGCREARPARAPAPSRRP